MLEAGQLPRIQTPLRDVHTEAYWESSSQELQLGESLGNGELCCQPVTTGLDRSHGNSGAGTALTRCPKLKPGHGYLDPHVDQPLDVSAHEKAYIRPSTSCLLRTAFTGDLSCGPLVASFPVPGGPEGGVWIMAQNMHNREQSQENMGVLTGICPRCQIQSSSLCHG